MRKYRFTACLIAALLSTSTVFADFNYSADYSNERVVINGVTNTETEEISVQVYKPNAGNISDSGNSIPVSYTHLTEENMKFLFGMTELKTAYMKSMCASQEQIKYILRKSNLFPSRNI